MTNEKKFDHLQETLDDATSAAGRMNTDDTTPTPDQQIEIVKAEALVTIAQELSLIRRAPR